MDHQPEKKKELQLLNCDGTLNLEKDPDIASIILQPEHVIQSFLTIKQNKTQCSDNRLNVSLFWS